MRPDFPHVWDSTMMNALRSCGIKLFREHFEHYKLATPNVHLHAGAAYAKGLEIARRAFYESGRPADEAVALGSSALMQAYGNFQCPEDSAKSLSRMLGALEFYSTVYPLGTDKATPVVLPSGRRAIEFSFAEPLEIKHPVTGDPLIYCGRSDMVAEYAGARYILDDKTASQLGASWPRQWELRSQFTGYVWGANKQGLSVTGTIVRGVSILKTKYDTLQAITFRPQWMIDRWMDQTIRDLHRAIIMWESGKWDYNLDESCNAYGGCPFKQVCVAEPKDEHIWLGMYFEKRKWDPLHRTETKLEN